MASPALAIQSSGAHIPEPAGTCRCGWQLAAPSQPQKRRPSPPQPACPRCTFPPRTQTSSHLQRRERVQALGPADEKEEAFWTFLWE